MTRMASVAMAQNANTTANIIEPVYDVLAKPWFNTMFHSTSDNSGIVDFFGFYSYVKLKALHFYFLYFIMSSGGILLFYGSVDVEENMSGKMSKNQIKGGTTKVE